MINTKFRKIAMIGLGYIGLPSAAILASRGVDVIGVDVNQGTVDTINEGRIHIIEPDLDIVVRSAVNTGKLRALTEPEPADAFLIAVPTPFLEDNSPDLSFVEKAVKSIAPYLEKGNLVVLESTSPVGTTEKISKWLSEQRPDLTFPRNREDNADIKIAHCPERVLPGQVLQELVRNDRIIGGMTPRCTEAAIELYKIFVKGECIGTTPRTAELCKLTENASRDVGIAFANELSLICDKLEVDVWELIDLCNRHPRVNILHPGPGVGGHCLAVDPWFIVDSAPKQTRLIRAAREVNNYKPHYVVERIRNKADRFKDPVIACFGLSYKSNIDDLRESPAMEIVSELLKENIGKISIVEPNISSLPESLSCFKKASLVDVDQALKESDIVVGLVDHDQFKKIDRGVLKTKVVLDWQGMWR